ncbi:MAG: hypothetical protein NC548_05585 [Lachnospiraceae bacterium]|nr:hypothetical protein [Lachnospiraceae bacterium]
MGAIPVQYVPDKVMETYRGKLAATLLEHGCHSVEIEKHPDLKQYIENYATKNVLECKVKDAIVGIVKKLALLNANLPNNETVTYPIIHTYRGHNLVETTIFYIDKDGNPTHEVIPLQQSSLIIP